MDFIWKLFPLSLTSITEPYLNNILFLHNKSGEIQVIILTLCVHYIYIYIYIYLRFHFLYKFYFYIHSNRVGFGDRGESSNASPGVRTRFYKIE